MMDITAWIYIISIPMFIFCASKAIPYCQFDPHDIDFSWRKFKRQRRIESWMCAFSIFVLGFPFVWLFLYIIRNH